VSELRGFAGAIAFLTRVPVGRVVSLDVVDISRGGAVFPLVGAGVGAVVGGLADGLAGSLTAPLAAVIGLAAGTLLTGALHVDGLADTADALGATTRERALEIMRDHAIGTYGAAAVALDLGAKVAALSVLAERGDALRLTVCAVAASRAVPVVLSAALPYARPGAGLGRALGASGPLRGLVAAALAAAFCVALGGAPLLAAAAGVLLLAGLLARGWLGGVTGDVLGAAVEAAEVAGLVVAVAIT